MHKPCIFISHVTEEREVARHLKELVEDKFIGTLAVFASSHENSIRMGDDWFQAIRTHVEKCCLMVVICSPISVSRPWINFEAGAGWVRSVPVVPMCHSGLVPGQLPFPLNTFQGGVIRKQEDLQKLFLRIAELNELRVPDASDPAFSQFIYDYETRARVNILLKDSQFVGNLLENHISLLEFCIFASTADDESLALFGTDNFDLASYSFTFNDVRNLFRKYVPLEFYGQSIYQVVHGVTSRASDVIRFVLSNNRLKLAPNLEDLLSALLAEAARADAWAKQIALIDQSAELKEVMCKMIRNETLPPSRQPSNLINVFIDYYDALVFYRNWALEYKKVMARLVPYAAAVPPANAQSD